MGMFYSAGKIKRWGLKGGIAILDQAVFSGANFILTIALARWLVPDQYGAYAIGSSLLIFFLQFLFTYIVEPMSVLGPSNYRANIDLYLSAQVRLYFIVMGLLGSCVALLLFVYRQTGWNPLVSSVLVSIGFSLPFILLPWLLRRVFYILGKPNISLIGSILYAAALLFSVYVARQMNNLTTVSSILAIAAAGAISGLFLLFHLNRYTARNQKLPLKHLFGENWQFGRWLVLSGVLMAIASQAQIYLTGTILGLKESGVIYALQALSQPMTLSVTAVTAILTPSLAVDFANNDIKAFRSKALSMTVVLVGMAVVFELFLIWFRIPLEQIIYGGTFSNYADLIPIWGLCPLITSLVSGMQYSLQAAKRPDSLFFASLFWLPVSFGVGLILIQTWGLSGAAWSIVIGYLTLSAILAFLYWHWLIRPSRFALLG